MEGFRNNVVLIAFVLLTLAGLEASQISGCSDSCTDYHHLCPAVHNSKFLQNYNEGIKNGLIEKPDDVEVPVSVDCSGMFWKLRCPKACGVCVTCGGFGSSDCGLPQPIHMINATGEEPLSGFSGIESAVDTFVLTADKDCYKSKSTKTGWAHFTIPMSVVTMVSIASLKGDQMDHYRVKVCAGSQQCVECGKMPTGSNRYWTHSDCPAETKGDRIEIRTDRFTEYLQFCEVEITGLSIGCANGSAIGPEKLLQIKSSSSSRPMDTNIPIKYAHDGYSHDTSQCYQSRDTKKGWANFKLSSAAQVTKVSVSVKTGSYADDYHIKVCTGDSNCVECSRMPQQSNVNPAWGDSTCPEGTTGDTIKIMQDPSADRLQLCEVKIYGRDNSIDEMSTSTGPMKLLPILKSKGMAAHSSYMQLTAAYDGILETTAACYLSESSTRGWAEFTIKESIVSKVSIAANTNGYTDNYHLQVCVGSKDCVECSDFPSKNSLQWADATCPEGTQGDTIRIYQDSFVSYLRLCEVKVTGTEVQPGAERKVLPYLLPIIESEGYSYYSGYKDTNAAHDGYVEDEKSCYKSSSSVYGWAKFKLEKVFLVTKVALAPIDDYDSLYYLVSVCTGDVHCIDCPYARIRGDRLFTDFVCPEGTRGDKIQIAQGKEQYLELCEVKVTGLDLGETDKIERGPPYALKINKATSYPKHSSYGDINYAINGYSYAGHPSYCYGSSSYDRGWAVFEFGMSQVTNVSIQIYDTNAIYYFASICINGSSCIECANFVHRGTYQWTTTSCPEGTYGNQLRIITQSYSNPYLRLCEVKVIGYDDLSGIKKSGGPSRILPILSAQASTQYSSAYPITLAYGDGVSNYLGMLDNELYYCYRSSATSGTFANFSIPMSRVTKVALAAASSGYSDDYLLSICTAGGVCYDCGYFNYASGYRWTVKECPEGTRGNLVRVTARYGFRLEICEIKIYGLEADNSTGIRGPARILEITSATAADYNNLPIRYAYDGNHHGNCYLSEDGNLGWANFKIKKSEVAKVTISTDKGSDADDYHVKVCSGDEDCIECGKMNSVGNYYWTDSICPPGTIGDNVRINQHPFADRLRLCEVKISGWDATDAQIITPGPPKLLKIQDAEGDRAKSQSYNIDVTYDGKLQTVTQCYESKGDHDGWITYTIATSEVTKVSLSAKTGTNMDEYYVQVCSSKKNCVYCSYLPSVSNLAWADSICPNGTIGNTIKLTQNPSADNLGICEVKITGYKGVTTPRDGKYPHKVLKIEDAEASDYKYGHEDIDAAYDGFINSKEECYKSDDDNYGYANFKISKSEVARVALSSITGSNTDNYRIKVCTGDSNCVFCSNMASTGNFKFVDSVCPEGTQGDTIKVTQDYEASGLEICELKVIGTPIMTR